MSKLSGAGSPIPGADASRRAFLRQATTLAAGVVAGTAGPVVGEPGSVSEPSLPTIKLGPHKVTRLILGGNPIYGHSHFNKLLSQYQIAWHTPERVLALLHRAEQVGINTWQNSYAERTLQDLDHFREAGGRLHWLCLGKPDWEQNPQRIAEAARRKPIGIAPHGSLAEKLYQQKRFTVLTDHLKRIRDQGVLVGLSAHNPALIGLAEEKGWDVDYYMCCLYYLTRPRRELEQLLGRDNVPLGEVFLPSDPPRMFETIRATRKPCLAYKVLAAGRRVDTPAQVRGCFETAFATIKPTDAVIVGMYQQLGDQVGENAGLIRSLCARPH